MIDRTHLKVIAVGAVMLAALCIVEALNFRDYFMDDSYVTFQYARNLYAGNGFVFNPGERVQGTTTPLYTFLLAPTFLFLDDPQTFSVFLTLAAWTAAAFLILVLFVRRGNPVGGLLAAAMIPVCPLVLRSLTMETGIYFMLIVVVFVLKETGHDRLACAAAALAFLTRFDGILLFPLAVIQRKNGTTRIPLESVLIVSIPTVLWLVFARTYFGTFLPNTFYSKAAVGSAFSWGNSFLKGFLSWSFDSVAFRSRVIFALFLVFSCVGLVFEFARNRRYPLIPLWLAFYAAGYFVINPEWSFHWYQAPLVGGLVMVQGNLAGGWFSRSGARRWRNLRLLLAGAWSVFAAMMVVFSLIADQSNRLEFQRPHLAEYKSMALKAQSLARPGDRIAAAEIGLIGFYSGCRVIDLAGLVSPEVRRARKEEGWPRAVADVVERTRPEFMVLNIDAGWSGRLLQNKELMSRYRAIEWGHKGSMRTVLWIGNNDARSSRDGG